MALYPDGLVAAVQIRPGMYVRSGGGAWRRVLSTRTSPAGGLIAVDLEGQDRPSLYFPSSRVLVAKEVHD